MNEERIKEIFSDEEFVKELFSKETPQEAQDLLAEKDIDLTVDEVVKIRNLLVKKAQAAQNGESAELTEEELGDVAGGAAVVVLVVLASVLGAAFVGTVGKVGYDIHVESRGRW